MLETPPKATPDPTPGALDAASNAAAPNSTANLSPEPAASMGLGGWLTRTCLLSGSGLALVVAAVLAGMGQAVFGWALLGNLGVLFGLLLLLRRGLRRQVAAPLRALAEATQAIAAWARPAEREGQSAQLPALNPPAASLAELQAVAAAAVALRGRLVQEMQAADTAQAGFARALESKGEALQAAQLAQLEMREQLRDLAHVERIAGLGTWRWRAADGMRWSDGLYRLLDLPVAPDLASRLSVLSLLGATHPADRPNLEAQLAPMQAGGAPDQAGCILRMQRADGEWVTVLHQVAQVEPGVWLGVLLRLPTAALGAACGPEDPPSPAST